VYVSAMPDSLTTPDAEKHQKLEEVLMIAGGNRMRAFQYLEHCKTALDPNALQICVSALDYLVSG
jgi:hypothetical protein